MTYRCNSMGEQDISILKTARLTLRKMTLDDAPFVLDLVNEPGWLRFIGDKQVHDLEGARGYIQEGPLASYERFGFGLYAVLRTIDATPLGMCGLLKRKTLDHVDLGFALFERHHGLGYARESAAAVLRLGLDDLALHRVVAITTVDNVQSAKVLESIGMRFQRMVRMSASEPELRLFAST